MPHVDFYYDFRSPYAYFASRRLSVLTLRGASIRWKPVSIDVLLNFQAGKDAWADYEDPLAPPKRAHLLADIPRMAAYWNIPMKSPNPRRPRSLDAMSIAAKLTTEGADHGAFRDAAFTAIWVEQRDLGDTMVIKDCLAAAGLDVSIADGPLDEQRNRLAKFTAGAYESGVFGVPTFVMDEEVYFGADRMDVLSAGL